jgi:hypothetical protein
VLDTRPWRCAYNFTPDNSVWGLLFLISF